MSWKPERKRGKGTPKCTHKHNFSIPLFRIRPRTHICGAREGGFSLPHFRHRHQYKYEWRSSAMRVSSVRFFVMELRSTLMKF